LEEQTKIEGVKENTGGCVPMMHKYNMCIKYNTYMICQYVYFENNRKWCYRHL